MKTLVLLTICLMLSALQSVAQAVPAVAKQSLEIRAVPLSKTVTPRNPVDVEISVINQGKDYLWLSHSWDGHASIDYYAQDQYSKHSLNYEIDDRMPLEKRDFIRLAPGEGVFFVTQISWHMLQNADRKPGEHTFIIKLKPYSGDRIGIKAWTGELTATLKLQVSPVSEPVDHSKEPQASTNPFQLRAKPLSTALSPNSAVRLELTAISRRDEVTWVCHRWDNVRFFLADAKGEHALPYVEYDMPAVTEDDFVLLGRNEGLIFPAVLGWWQMKDADTTPGEKTFVVKVNPCSGDRLGIKAWTATLATPFTVNVADK